MSSDVQREMVARCTSLDGSKSGLITIEQLRQIMTQMGEDLSMSEIEEMVIEAKCGQGKDQVNYEKFLAAFFDEGEEGEEEENNNTDNHQS